ncbi:MAG TPA: cytochrome b/b6 domain-containing protein [Methylophilaceae bacterium]|nr:cytochrome b/b6 domain-containing protein [Methylophilaceae bacterium]HQR60433.1 cytochrome b/b6 domain-containing protein [Methylophilaceae bacterium]
MLQRILVWDMPTRVFHWLLAISFTGAFLTAETERYRDIHVMLGYTLLGLIAFRLVWGFAGTRYAQFRSFLFAPGQVVDYLKSLVRREPQHYVGHNPAGSLAIFLLLGLGLLAAISGILLYFEVGGEEAFEELHEGAANFMLAVVIIHIAGVVVSSWLHRENLARAMLTGYKSGEAQQGIPRTHAWLGAIILAAVAAFWVWYPASGTVTG